MVNIMEYVPLAPRTTLGVGGSARFFVTVHSKHELIDTFNEARKRNINVYIFGAGSNTLVPDKGIDGLVLRMDIQGITSCDEDNGTSVLVHAGAGVMWDSLVRYTTMRGLWGIENLAGIPGTVGAAPVQNIGAYGAELSDVFVCADTIIWSSGNATRISAIDAQFGYRESFFKKDSSFVITNVTLRLFRTQIQKSLYVDLVHAKEQGEILDTSEHIANTIRHIRAKKFPIQKNEGTAGSFFKNPIVTKNKYKILCKQFTSMPGFEIGNNVKIPLAWILDNVLHLRGFQKGMIRLYEHHPLVLVARAGARATEIEMFARMIVARVQSATGIFIEREVRTCNYITEKK